MITTELKLPATKKTRDQIVKDWMINSAKRTSSKGAYDKFKKKILDARKKDLDLLPLKKEFIDHFLKQKNTQQS